MYEGEGGVESCSMLGGQKIFRNDVLATNSYTSLTTMSCQQPYNEY